MAVSNLLINRITSICKAGESYNNDNILKNKQLEIENFITQFDEVFKKFNDTITCYKALQKIDALNNKTSAFFSNITSIQNKCVQLKDKVLNNDYERKTITNLKRDIDRIKKELQNIWESYISERVSSIDGVLKTLGGLIYEMPEKQVLQSKKDIFTNSLIGSQDAVIAINEYVDIYDALMNKLHLSDDILAFLKRLTSGSHVTLSDMNEDVYEWIKNSDFADKINLRI